MAEYKKKKTKQRIAVLGAGPMGLAVAYQLLQDGWKPVLFEADDRIGGMTACFDFNGLSIERYYHFHCTSDHAFLEILDELGIAAKMRWVETKMGYWYQGHLQPWGNPGALLRFEGLSLSAKVRYGIHAFMATKRNNWAGLDNIRAIDWIQHWVGEEAYNVLWRQLFDYKFYGYAKELSAAWIWSRIRRVGRSRYNLFREKLGYLEGGSNVFLRAIQSFIEINGGEIQLQSSVKKVVLEEGRVKGINIAPTTGTKDVEEFLVFDNVVSTIPLPYIPKIIPDLPVDLLSRYLSMKNIAVVCVTIQLRRAVSRNFWLNINDSNMDIPGFVEYTNLRRLGQNQHIVYVPFYMPEENPKFLESDQIFIGKVKNYLCKINSSLNEEDFLNAKVSRYRYAQPICGPNYLQNLPPINLPVQGLWVADTSYYYPEDRSISESIALGRRIAKQVVA